MEPRVEHCTSNAQQLTHQADSLLYAMLFDKAVLHSGCSAKYRMAFLIYLALGFQQLLRKLNGLTRSWGLHPLVQAVCRYTQVGSTCNQPFGAGRYWYSSYKDKVAQSSRAALCATASEQRLKMKKPAAIKLQRALIFQLFSFKLNVSDDADAVSQELLVGRSAGAYRIPTAWGRGSGWQGY